MGTLESTNPPYNVMISLNVHEMDKGASSLS